MIDTATRPHDFAAARKAMIVSQLRTSGVNTPVILQRMASVPREHYVPSEAHGFCYMDRSIALPDGGTLAQPVSHGKMLALAAPRPEENALVVDNSNGYLAALVEPLVGKMTVISPEEAAAGKKRGAFDLILIDGAIEALPPALAKRLGDDGRVVTGLAQEGVTSLAIGRRTGKEVAFRRVEDIALPRLSVFDTPKSWAF
ncbi:MAG: protein-L-isoaspartate O-methyltransferase [Erythrobacter sp.]|jgi:protein-L-isoaspartate(D-aspartate) O-methyltransferase|nr:protein-L-isoaspartate O-methyltransferase [Erythrobacter sp.]RZV35637.1 MAG: protein-L-isoaspartate O-methyltransferase [Sphingomonadaceae bacterium]